ncbi:unnamed protein product [Caenorhabditis auriculariae]|uniref:Uncharacterized protein n=1 Tax=Caenorhabditis auriculariae TaxID=2777116 RepID=A0A8S1HCS3_9PELO|nr:unnamed protein product [Caenorhabditis auriculariae]
MQSRARKTPRNLQPPILLEKLDQLGNRFQMIEVRKVLIGNLNTERTHIPSDNTMVVTKDLMQFVTSNCYGVRTLVFQNCIVDEDSLKFMASEEFTIKNRLKEVVLDNIRYDDDESVKNFSNLITHETRCLSFNQCSISFMESVVLEKLRSLNHRVDLVNIGFDENESDPKREIFIEEFKQYSKLVIPMGRVTVEKKTRDEREHPGSWQSIFGPSSAPPN